MYKRLWSIILATLLLATMLPAGVSAVEIVSSGSCGTSLTWTLDDAGILTISGTGDMYDWGLLNNESIPWYAHRNEVVSVVIQQGVTSIGETAFCKFSNLTDISIPETVTTINSFAFYGCTSLEKMQLPASLKTIGGYVFSGCSKLSELSIAQGESAFCVIDNILYSKDVTNLVVCPPAKKSVSIPNTVAIIEYCAFNDCYNIVDLYIPNSVKTINNYAITYCTSLEKIYISGNARILENAINDCTSLVEINVEDSTIYSSIDGVLYNKEQTTLIMCPEAKGNIAIPNTVKTIKEGAFGSCDLLYEISLPDNVETIEESAFSGCSNLQSITLPSSLTQIQPYTFSNCRSLASITIPSGVDSIGRWTFYGCTALKHLLYAGTQGMWNNIIKDDIQLPRDAVITYNYTDGTNYHTYDDSKDSDCNICGQFRLIGCAESPVGVEITTHQDYDFSLVGINPSLVSIRFTGQSSIIIGSYATHCKGYELVFSQPGSYELRFVQDVTGSTISFTAEITAHDWQFSTRIPPSCVDVGYDLYVCSYCAEEDHRNQVNTVEHTWNSGVITKQPTCTENGTKRYTCTTCGATTEERVGATGHTYRSMVTEPTCATKGYTTHTCACGNTYVDSYVKATEKHTYNDNVDGICNVCGVERQNTENRTVMHMFRMYDPNSGEHFYTGSEEERDNLVAVGWNYEGVGFTFSRTTGAPVHRLYDPVTGEHLYTMDDEEKTMLMVAGWNYEGIAFNSAYDTEVHQYRLHNPNATRGAYHFTASIEERDFLISIGWEYQGIGWYSCWK